MLNKITELKYGNTRCFCVNDILLVDTDWAGTLPAFYRCAKGNHIDLTRLQYLIISHFHPDHMGIAQELAELGITIIVFDVQQAYIHSSDHVFTRNEHVPFMPISDDTVLHIACADSRRFLCGLGIAGEVIHTPGHSEDSVSLILDDGIAIVGDLYPLDFVEAYHSPQLEDSWNRILSHGITRIHYGHAPDDVLHNVHALHDIL